MEKACKGSMGLDLKPIFMTSKVAKSIGFLVQRRTALMDFTGPRPTPIDPEVREEYWTIIRKQPSKVHHKTT